MFIRLENTPNSHVIKFCLNIPVGNGQTYNRENNVVPDVVEELFLIEEIEEIFFGADFVSIKKNVDSDWDLIKTKIISSLVDAFSVGFNMKKEYNGNANNISDNFPDEVLEIDDVLLKKVNDIIEERIRPSLAADGGDMKIISFKDGILKVKFLGACSGCPMSSVTMSNGVERILKHYLPEIESIEQI